jgi:peptide/nickel transport system substrate-binding protein
LKKPVIAGLTVAIIVIVIAGYWFSLPTPPPPKVTTTTTAATTTTQRKGGTLTVGVAKEPNSLDPTIALLDFPQFTGLKALYDGLVISDYEGNIKMALAESYKLLNDTTYVFSLRKGVKFHDGTPFNASCVVFFDWYIRNGPGTQGRTSYITKVKSAEALDEYTVRYTLTSAYPTFVVDILRVGPTGGIPSPSAIKKWGQEFGTHPVGTGPFKFVEWVRGSTIKLVANDDYWQGRPDIDVLVLKYIPDEAVRIMELKAGTSDLIPVPLKFASDLKRTQGISLLAGTAERQMQLSWAVTDVNPAYKSYFTDKRVRQAVNYAIDKKEIVNTILDGWAAVSVSMVRYGYLGYAPYLEKYTYDVTKAKQLLAEAGYPNGFECQLLTESRDFRPYAEESAVLIQNQLAKVGIKVNIKVVDGASFANMRFKQEFDLAMGGWRGNGLADTPHAILNRVHSRNAGPGAGQWNWENIRDPKLDSLIEKLEATSLEDVAIWKPLSDEIQKIVIEEAYECPLFDEYRCHATTAKVKGYGLDPTIGAMIWAPQIGVKVSLDQTGTKQSAPMAAGLTSPFTCSTPIPTLFVTSVVAHKRARCLPN